MENSKVFDLEDRLIEFASEIIDIVDALPATRAASYIAGQLIRCGLAPALLYGEVQAAESREDFIHKMKIALKELKETRVCLKLIDKKKMIKSIQLIADSRKENEELVAIVAKSVETARKNVVAQKNKK